MKTLPFLFLFITCFLNIYKSNSQTENNLSWYTNYDVKWYGLDIKSTDTSTFISGSASMKVQILEDNCDTFKFELGSNNTIDSVKLNNKKVKYIINDYVVSVPLNKPAHKGDYLISKVYYSGNTQNRGFFSAYSSKRDDEWKIPVTWSLSEPFGARAWFPCKQSLSDKADSVDIKITVPKYLKAGSNGLLQSVTKVDTSMNCYHWKSKYPTAFYLISATISDYKDYSFYAHLNLTDSVLVQNYIYNRPGFLEKNKSDIDETGNFLKLFSELYGTYPFKNEKYGHCVAPMGGGMEHQTMTTLSGFEFDLVSHELAHQWFGDYVTCGSWQDIWVNEGFASYSEYLALEFLKSKESATDWMQKAMDFVYYVPEGSVYVPENYANNENRIFSYSLTYKKGAAIIHMLRNEIGNDSLFFAILKEYLATNAFKNATTPDFISIVNRKTGRDFNPFFKTWYYGKGFPVCTFYWTTKNDSLKIWAYQKSSVKNAAPFNFNLEIKVKTDTGNFIFQNSLNSDLTIINIPFKAKINKIVFNPEFKTLMNVNGSFQINDFPTNDSYFTIEEGLFFSSNLTLKINGKPAKKQIVKIVDLNGQQVFEREYKKQSKISIDTKWFDKGNYLLYLQDKDTNYIRIINKNSF